MCEYSCPKTNVPIQFKSTPANTPSSRVVSEPDPSAPGRPTTRYASSISWKSLTPLEFEVSVFLILSFEKSAAMPLSLRVKDIDLAQILAIRPINGISPLCKATTYSSLSGIEIAIAFARPVGRVPMVGSLANVSNIVFIVDSTSCRHSDIKKVDRGSSNFVLGVAVSVNGG